MQFAGELISILEIAKCQTKRKEYNFWGEDQGFELSDQRAHRQPRDSKIERSKSGGKKAQRSAKFSRQ